MHRPERPAEIGPARFTRLIVFVLAVLGSAVGVANLPSGANAQPQTQVDSGYVGFDAITKPTCPRPRPSPTPSPSPSPSPSPTPAPAYSGPPTLPPSPTPSRTPKPTKRPTPTPVPTPYVPPGIDVSRYQGTLAWPKVARAGIRFVYVKATQGTTIVDSYFAEHSSRAQAQGIAIGAYHFFDYTSDGRAQADFFVDTVMSETGFDGTLPPVVDVECWLAYGRADQDVAIAEIRAFLGQTYIRTGRMPMIYTSQYMWTRLTRNNPGFAQYPLWVACWSCDAPFMPAGWTTWLFWQTGSTRIIGIDKTIDADIFNGVDGDIAPLKGGARQIATVNGQYVTTAKPSLDLSGRDGIAFHYSVDGTTWKPWQAYSPSSPVKTLSLGPDGPKTVLVQLRDPQGNLSPISTQPVIVDSVAPALKPFTTSLPLGPMADANGFMSVGVRWAVSDATSGLASALVTGACGAAAPATLQSVDQAHAGPQRLSLAVRAGDGCTFRADVADNAGLTSASTEPTSFSMALAQEANGNATWGGRWQVANDVHMSEGKSRYSSAPGAAVTYRFRGTDVALIATTSPSRGRARVSIDGKPVAIIDEYSPTIAYRQRVFTTHLPLGEHKVTIQVLGTHNPRSKGSRVDIDAFQVLVPGGSLASYMQPCREPASPTSGLLAEIGL